MITLKICFVFLLQIYAKCLFLFAVLGAIDASLNSLSLKEQQTNSGKENTLELLSYN